MTEHTTAAPGTAVGSTDLPLDGVTVVSVEQAVSAPFVTRQLADLGARVIKVERPGTGDFARLYDESVNGESSYFVWLNRSKESIEVDLKTPAGREVMSRLVDRADVIVQNLGPGAARRLGFGADDIRSTDRSKIVLDITGWGSDGPWADRKAYDLLVQGEAGLLSLTGTPESACRVGISVADIAAGMYGFAAVLAALYRRERTGEGATLEVSLFDALSEWMGQPLSYTAGSGVQQARVGGHHATIAPYGPFSTGDGRTIFMAVQNQDEWTRFCDVFMRDPDLALHDRFRTNSRRVAHRDELIAAISSRFRSLDGDAAVTLLSEARIAFAGVNDMRAFLDHAVMQARERWTPVMTPSGEVRALQPPINIADCEPRMDPVPGLGEHTSSILVELGLAGLQASGPAHGRQQPGGSGR